MRERMRHGNGSRRAPLMLIQHDMMRILKLAKHRGDFRRRKARCLGQLVHRGRAAFFQVELEELVANVASGVIHLG